MAGRKGGEGSLGVACLCRWIRAGWVGIGVWVYIMRVSVVSAIRWLVHGFTWHCTHVLAILLSARLDSTVLGASACIRSPTLSLSLSLSSFTVPWALADKWDGLMVRTCVYLCGGKTDTSHG